MTKVIRMTSSKSKTGLLLFVAIALLGFNIYQWMSSNKLKATIENNKTELVSLEKIQAELDKDYQDALASIEALRDDNQKMNDAIESQKIELKSQKDKINDLIWSKRELGRAKEEMKSLNILAAKYVEELKVLKSENERLASNNVKLTKEKEVLTFSLEEEKKATTELSQAKVALVSKNEVLSEEKQQLDSKVEMASVIKINWLEVKGFQTQDDGKLKKKRKAKDVNVLRICYKTEANYIAKAGEEEFYVRYISPLGETLAVEDLGSGILFDKFTGKEVRYSTSGNLDYNNEDAEGCIDWQFNFKINKGVYDVELYNKGYLCGKGNFKLK